MSEDGTFSKISKQSHFDKDRNGYHGSSIPDSTPEVVVPQFLPARSPESEEFRATWLGHACFYVEFPGGLRALFDPVFSQRCSPVQFMGPKRVTKMPCEIKDIPSIDIVVISHNHYDHMDYNTIMKLTQFHPNVWFFVPLGNKSWYTCSPTIPSREKSADNGIRTAIGSPAQASQTAPKWIGGTSETWSLHQLSPSPDRDLLNLKVMIRS